MSTIMCLTCFHCIESIEPNQNTNWRIPGPGHMFLHSTHKVLPMRWWFWCSHLSCSPILGFLLCFRTSRTWISYGSTSSWATYMVLQRSAVCCGSWTFHGRQRQTNHKKIVHWCTFYTRRQFKIAWLKAPFIWNHTIKDTKQKGCIWYVFLLDLSLWMSC